MKYKGFSWNVYGFLGYKVVGCHAQLLLCVESTADVLLFLTGLKLPTGKTTVMHLVSRETVPEPQSAG